MWLGERGEHRKVCGVAGGREDGTPSVLRFAGRVFEIGERLGGLVVDGLIADDEGAGGSAGAEGFNGVDGGLFESGMMTQAEIVVAGEVEHRWRWIFTTRFMMEPYPLASLVVHLEGSQRVLIRPLLVLLHECSR